MSGQTSLGTIAKFSPHPPLGHSLVPSGLGDSATIADLRAASQNSEEAIRRLGRLERFALQEVARKVLPKYRVSSCLRRRIPGRDVEVWKSAEHGSTHYKGLQVCGSVWTCPVCAAKISERRRAELVSVVASWRASGGEVALITLTNPHYRADKLSDLVAGQRRAYARLTRGKAWDKLREKFGFDGTVRTWEVTHGDNGWHPHFHVLTFLKAPADLQELQDLIGHQWKQACKLAGLPVPSDAHGCRVDDGSKAAKYASKWGIESEMTKGHIAKKAKGGGSSPFDFLRRLLADENDRQAAVLFSEFAEAFKGMSQLRWSKGLRGRFGLGVASDEQIAEGGEEDSLRLGQIPADDWRRVLWVDGRATILELARHGWQFVREYLDSLHIILGDVGGGKGRAPP